MKRLFFFILLNWVLVFPTMAQLPKDYRSEQIFLCPQKTVWTTSDTIEVEGQVTCLAENRTYPYSQYLYVEWINDKDSVLVRQKVSCKNKGYFNTRIPQDPTSEAGIYYLRAYTNLMRNFSSSSFALQPILVNQSFPSQETHIDEDIQCMVYPSGGKLVPDAIQSVTAYLTDYLGNPISGEKLSLLKGERDTIAESITSLSGMANLKFIPQKGVHYQIAFVSKNIKKTFSLPQIDKSSMKIEGTLNGAKLHYEILNAPNTITDCRLYIYNHETGVKRVNLERKSGIIAFAQPSPYTTLFLTDKDNTILSEYTVCGKYKKEQFAISQDTIYIGEDILLKQPLSKEGMVMVRLVDTNDQWVPHAESTLLYESDLSSPIPFPSHIFQEKEQQRNTDLQSWLNTATFKRFNIKDAIQKGETIYNYMPEENLSFHGKVENENLHPIKKGILVAYNTENNLVYDIPLDSLGRFHIAVDDFTDGTSFFLQVENIRNKPIFANISVEGNTFPSVNFQHAKLKKTKYAEDIATSVEGRFKNQTLPDIVVKAHLVSEKPKPTNKFYSTNFADREEIEKHNYTDLEEILTQMPGLAKVKTALSAKFYTTRGVSTLKGSPLPIIIDGVKLDTTMVGHILSMPAFEIKEVELLRPWQALQYTSGAIDGAVLVKTRNRTKALGITSKGTYYTPIGLTGSTNRKSHFSSTPTVPGTYRLLVDIVSELGIRSYEKLVTVVE